MQSVPFCLITSISEQMGFRSQLALTMPSVDRGMAALLHGQAFQLENLAPREVSVPNCRFGTREETTDWLCWRWTAILAGTGILK